MLSTDLADLRAHMAQNPGAVIEDVAQPKGLHGHLRHERCAAIAFVERPFMGKSSAFIAFLNVDGGIMFKVFVGRDEARALRQDQLERFNSLAGKIGAAGAA
jgi:putative heme iron utilization protein